MKNDFEEVTNYIKVRSESHVLKSLGTPRFRCAKADRN